MAVAYYNEIDPFAAAWLRELIRQGHIAPGDVDERSIVDVQPNDLVGYTQCHFFAGIGGWSLALRLAGWPDDRPVWTGSCPCQPFSAAGKRKGTDDSRHLWPALFRLIRECRPRTVFGEQVDGPAALAWWDLVSTDLESDDYAAASIGLPSACVESPNIRQRLWWVAESTSHGRQHESSDGCFDGAGVQSRGPRSESRAVCLDSRVADTNGGHTSNRGLQPSRRHSGQPTCATATNGLADTVFAGRPEGWAESGHGSAPDGGAVVGVGHADDARSQGRDERWDGADERALGASSVGSSRSLPSHIGGRPIDWLFCRDGKWRPVESGTFPLATELPARVGRLRGYGNAINPEVAAEVIAAYMEIR